MDTEQGLENIREHLAEVLDNISHIGSVIQKKSGTLLHEIANVNQMDAISLERIGLGMVKMLNTLNINVIGIINFLENDLKKLNEKRSDLIFKDLLKMLENKKPVFVMNVTKDVNVSPISNVHKETQTDRHNNPEQNDLQSAIENEELKNEIESTVVPDKHVVGSRKKSFEDMNIGLIRTNTQDTDDDWLDSINRSPSALDLLNKGYEGDKIKTADQFLRNLKEELSNEESAWDRKTEDSNHDIDNHTTSDDDTFIDGKAKDEEETILMSDTAHQSENSNLDCNENKNLDSTEMHVPDTESSNEKPKDDVMANEQEPLSQLVNQLNSEAHISDYKELSELADKELNCNNDVIEKESCENPEINVNVNESDIAEDKQDLNSRDSEIDSEENQPPDNGSNALEQKKTKESVIGTLSTFDDDMSAALSTIADHIEALTSIDPLDNRDEEQMTDKTFKNTESVSANLNHQITEPAGSNQSDDNSNSSLNEDESLTLKTLCDQLESAQSNDENNLESNCDNLPLENLEKSSDENTQAEMNQIISSQETVDLDINDKHIDANTESDETDLGEYVDKLYRSILGQENSEGDLHNSEENATIDKLEHTYSLSSTVDKYNILQASTENLFDKKSSVLKEDEGLNTLSEANKLDEEGTEVSNIEPLLESKDLPQNVTDIDENEINLAQELPLPVQIVDEFGNVYPSTCINPPEISVINETNSESICNVDIQGGINNETLSISKDNETENPIELQNTSREPDVNDESNDSEIDKLATDEIISSHSSSKSFIFDISENYIDIEETDSVGDALIPELCPTNSTEKNDENVLKTTKDNEVHNTETVDHNSKENKALDSLSNTQLEASKFAHRDVEKSIEILSDSDDDVRLDVTMEEILSPGSPVNVEKRQEENGQNAETIDIKEEVVIEENVEENSNEYSNCTTQQGIGDELLELLREVEVPSANQPSSEPNQNHITRSSSKKDIKDADEIFKLLQEESLSELSDSDTSYNSLSLSSLETEILENDSDDLKHKTQKKRTSSCNVETDLCELYNLRECCVFLKRLEQDGHKVKVNNNLFDSIDRLCDLSNIINKRKSGDPPERSRMKKAKKLPKSKKDVSDSDSLSDFSYSDSDDTLKPDLDENFGVPLEQKLDDMLANEICKGLRDDSSSESTDVDSDCSKKSSKKKETNEKGKTLAKDTQKKHKLSREERRKKAWKNDPLLRGKLTSDESSSSSSSDSEKSFKKRRALRTKYEHDTDFCIKSDGSDFESDGSDTVKQDMATKLAEKVISPIKKNIPLSESSSDTDSDIEFLDADESEAESSSTPKGRRNIRALMSDESLTEATQRANKEEQERINRLEDRHRIKETLSQSLSQTIEEDALVLDVDAEKGEPLVQVHRLLNKRLKPHQKSGVQFMWDACYESVERIKVDDGSGCVLAHCMGLGKTFQVLTLIHTLFSYETTNTKHVLVVCPLSTVNNWKKEVKIAFKHFPDDKLNILVIADKKELSQKYDIVKKWRLRKKSVLVMGYEGFETLTNETKLEKISHHLKERVLEALVDPGPDLVICDEGHLLRNKKALKTLALNKIRTKRRIVLTGTPLQNNLLEYYFMVNFVKPNLLGNLKEFKTNFVNPIVNGQYEDSTSEDIKLMMKRTHVLHKLLKRTIQRVEDTELQIYLPKMVDHAIFIQLSQVQVDLYNKFSQLVAEKSININRKGFLSDFSVFQYICTHPHLLAIMENLRKKKIKERDLITTEDDNPLCNIEGWWKAIIPPDVAEKIAYGNKLVVVKSIIEECEEIGDKVLLFSQSLGELDLIEHFLQKEGTAKCPSWKRRIDYSRMDGTVPPTLRSTICDLFNDKDNKKLRLLLMSTKVGGLGLNLTAANRVIIMTVNWNPSYDIQSVFRVYRFGQEKEVYVYRLVALDAMEEKAYQRTITKLAVAHRVVDKHQITRHYKSIDLQELYSCKPNADKERPISNVPEDKVLAKLILKLPCIFKHHEHQALLANRPEDNLNEHELNAAWDEFKRIKDAPLLPPQQPQNNISQPPYAIPNGPTYTMAYSLSKLATSFSAQKTSRPMENDKLEMNRQFYKLSEKTNKIIMKPPQKFPAPTIRDKGGKEMIPIPQANKNIAEQDPLFIPLSKRASGTIRTHSDILTRNPFAFPKMPSDTTIVVEDSPDRNSAQKENSPGIRPNNTNPSSIIVLDDESNKAHSSALSNYYMPNTPHIKPLGSNRKRKIDENHGTDKRKKAFTYFPPIEVDDDEISIIPDTASESDSLTNELIQNLGRGGVTISKVTEFSQKNISDTVAIVRNNGAGMAIPAPRTRQTNFIEDD